MLGDTIGNRKFTVAAADSGVKVGSGLGFGLGIGRFRCQHGGVRDLR